MNLLEKRNLETQWRVFAKNLDYMAHLMYKYGTRNV